MFLPPKLKTIGFCWLFSALMLSSSVNAQQSDFSRRIEAMQQARLRAQQPPEPVYVAANDDFTEVSIPPTPPEQRVASISSIPGQFNRATGRYFSQPIRTAQLIDESIEDMGSPIMDSVTSSTIGEEIIEGGCDSCGNVGGFFGDQCCGRGGCPPGPCWLSGFGTILCNGEYFAGATAFRSALFATPGVTTGDLSSDASHGFYEGFNFGMPLCRLTCGVFSGQFGVRTTQSNFNGSEFTTDDRNQIFITTGLYRRVDYGLQMGMVVDYLHDDWFLESEVTQIRGDLGWVYPSGATLGFRFASNVDDDLSDGVFAGNNFTNLLTTTNDNYRFYYRCEPQQGGFFDGFIGWSDTSQTVLGLDFDMPVRERAALQAGFTYYLNNDGVPANAGFQGGNAAEAYNFYVGVALRPRGRSHYQSYDRPLFSVADNGSMLILR